MQTAKEVSESKAMDFIREINATLGQINATLQPALFQGPAKPGQPAPDHGSMLLNELSGVVDRLHMLREDIRI